jgi:hypothetical protein
MLGRRAGHKSGSISAAQARTSKTSLSAVGLRSDENGSKALADFLEVRAGRLLYHLAVPQEYEGRPELDLKRSPELFPFAILDLDVSNNRITFE